MSRKDPKTIAMLVKDGRYMEPYIPEGVYAELRIAMNIRWQIVKNLNSIKNQINRWLRIYFPEFLQVFVNWEGVASLVVLHELPTPVKVVKKGITGILERWKQDKIRAVGIKRAKRLVEAANASAGIKEGLIAAEMELKVLLKDYDRKMEQYKAVMDMVEKLIPQIARADEVLKIKGIGLVRVAGFIAEVGDISRFSHPKQIQKFAGLNLRENSSGKHKGKTGISKRRLRAILFRTMMPLVAKNKEFKAIHEYYTTRLAMQEQHKALNALVERTGVTGFIEKGANFLRQGIGEATELVGNLSKRNDKILGLKNVPNPAGDLLQNVGKKVAYQSPSQQLMFTPSPMNHNKLGLGLHNFALGTIEELPKFALVNFVGGPLAGGVLGIGGKAIGKHAPEVAKLASKAPALIKAITAGSTIGGLGGAQWDMGLNLNFLLTVQYKKFQFLKWKNWVLKLR